MRIDNSVREINRVLDKQHDNEVRMGWAIDRITWLHKFRKVPREITNALSIKAVGMMEGTWFGDEPEEEIIKRYISQ